MESIYQQIIKAQKEQKNVVLCSIVNTKGSTPCKNGAKMLVFENGEVFGSVGGGNFEHKVTKDALEALTLSTSKLLSYDLLKELSMCCGGTVEVFIEPIFPRNKLYIFGAGHIGNALQKNATKLDFEVFIIDDRAEVLNQIENKNMIKIYSNFTDYLNKLTFDNRTYIVIATYKHEIDKEILAFCLNKTFAYLGMIGSMRKAIVTRKKFTKEGIATVEQIQKVDMPIGLNIQAEGPEEISISILAKLIEVKNTLSNRILSNYGNQ